jgi:hypothetical protein
MLKRIEKDTRIEELTCVWTVLRKPGGYPEFPVFPWPSGPGYKRRIPSVERRRGFPPKSRDVKEDTGYTPKRAAIVHCMIAPAGYQLELDLSGELLLLPQRIALKFSHWDEDSGSSSELLESDEEAHKEEVWKVAAGRGLLEEDQRPESVIEKDLENRPRWPQEQQPTLPPPLSPTLEQAAGQWATRWAELIARLTNEGNNSDDMPELERLSSDEGDIPQYKDADPRCCPSWLRSSSSSEEDVPQDMDLDQPALVLSDEDSDDNDLPRLVCSDKDSSESANKQQQGTQVNSGVPTKQRVASTKWKTRHCTTEQVKGAKQDDNDDEAEDDDDDDRYAHQLGSLRRLEEARDQVHTTFWSGSKNGPGLNDTIVELTAAATGGHQGGTTHLQVEVR